MDCPASSGQVGRILDRNQETWAQPVNGRNPLQTDSIGIVNEDRDQRGGQKPHRYRPPKKNRPLPLVRFPHSRQQIVPVFFLVSLPSKHHSCTESPVRSDWPSGDKSPARAQPNIRKVKREPNHTSENGKPLFSLPLDHKRSPHVTNPPCPARRSRLSSSDGEGPSG